MGLGPRRVVDNQGKVRSGSAYFPFTVPLAAGTQPRRHGLPARRFVPEKTICADVGLHGMDIHLGEVYAQAPRSDPASAKALRCGQSLSARPSRTAYLSRCLAWRYRHAPGRSVHASQPGKRFIHKPGRDSAKRAVADPGLRRYRPGGALAFGSQGVPRRALGHYSMEIVSNLAVWLGGECQVGQGSAVTTALAGSVLGYCCANPLTRAPSGISRSPPSAASSACRHPSIRWKAATTEPFPRLSISFFLPGCGPAAAQIRSPETCGKPQGRRVDKPAEALCITPHVDNEPFHPQLKNAYQQGPDRVWDSLIIRYRLCLYWARRTYQQKSRC